LVIRTAGSTFCEEEELFEVLKDFVLALSLSNLWFLNVWRLFLIQNSSSYPYYHWKANPAPILLATVLDVLLLSATLWVAVTLARRSKKPLMLRIARGSFLLMFLVAVINVLVLAMGSIQLKHVIKAPLDRLRLVFPTLGLDTLNSYLWLLGALVCLVLSTILLHGLVYRRSRLLKIAAGIVLILSPFVFVTFSQAASQWMRFRAGEQFRDNTAPPVPQPAKRGKRILWIIFDEMDYRLSFVNRPPTTQLPEFDRLRKESIFAGNAYPPGGDTVISLPALITGRLVAKSTPTAPNELMLTFGDNDQTLPWSTQPNVFSSARAMGFNTAMAGWYHPYCRIIGRSLTQCFRSGGLAFVGNKATPNSVAESNLSLAKRMLQLGVNVFVPDVIRLFGRNENASTWRRSSFQSYLTIHQQALAWVTDPDLQLIMIHYPIPHPPGIYDRSKHDFSFNSSSGYLDNLSLADRALGELRKQMEQAGLWETTTVLVSSDHSLRGERVWRNHAMWTPSITQEDPAVLNSQEDERVPFILKLAGQGRGVMYEAAFNTVVSHDLLLAFLSGQVQQAEDVVKWLDEHRSIAQSPYVEEDY
jgi:Sulfatase